LEIIIYILISFTLGFLLGRRIRFRTKNYGVTRKMFLTLERSEIDRKVEIALEHKDYESAIVLERKRNRLDKKLKRVKRKEIKK
tara:strand:- start:486 stop:737 length:252 start_codon:yes stop_codon:yes gene_type:complete